MRVPSRVTLVEVGPRDGFQMERAFIPTQTKVQIVNALAGTGIRKIETTSFVHPKRVPQMADAAQVMGEIERVAGVSYTALAPNLKGAQRAIEAGVDGIRLVICASEAYNVQNVGQSISQTLSEFDSILQVTDHSGVSVDAIIGLCFGCPLEGDISPGKVLGLVEELVRLGFREICIADSVGLANPAQVGQLVRLLRDKFPSVLFSLHFHDTRGLGLANVLAGMEEGIVIYDASVGGLGGCPVVPGATGNIATEDLVNMLHEMGVETGIDMAALIACARTVEDRLGRRLESRVLRSGTRAQLYCQRAFCASAEQ